MQRPYMPSLGAVQVLEVHDPAVAITLQMTHLGLAENLRTVIAGVRQIVHQGGVLGLVVTARDAVATVVARQLLDPDVVEVVGQLGEGHVDRRLVEMRPLLEKVRGLLVGLEPGQGNTNCGKSANRRQPGSAAIGGRAGWWRGGGCVEGERRGSQKPVINDSPLPELPGTGCG